MIYRRPWFVVLVVFLALSTGVATGCNGDAPATIEVTLTDASITVEPQTADPGPTTFSVQNDGELLHELAIIRTDLPPDDLPIRDGSWVDEEAPGMELIAELEHSAPGREKELTADLEPGSYVLISNVEGDYQLGMFAELEVEP